MQVCAPRGAAASVADCATDTIVANVNETASIPRVYAVAKTRVAKACSAPGESPVWSPTWSAMRSPSLPGAAAGATDVEFQTAWRASPKRAQARTAYTTRTQRRLHHLWVQRFR